MAFTLLYSNVVEGIKNSGSPSSGTPKGVYKLSVESANCIIGYRSPTSMGEDLVAVVKEAFHTWKVYYDEVECCWTFDSRQEEEWIAEVLKRNTRKFTVD